MRQAGHRKCPVQVCTCARATPGDRIGSSFDDFLKEDGLHEEVTARAIKRVIARQLDALMREKRLTKTVLARRMRTSRAQLDRALDPDNDSVTLGTLTRAAHAVGRKLRLEVV